MTDSMAKDSVARINKIMDNFNEYNKCPSNIIIDMCNWLKENEEKVTETDAGEFVDFIDAAETLTDFCNNITGKLQNLIFSDNIKSNRSNNINKIIDTFNEYKKYPSVIINDLHDWIKENEKKLTETDPSEFAKCAKASYSLHSFSADVAVKIMLS